MAIDSIDLRNAAAALRRYRCILPEGHPDREHANKLANRLAVMAMDLEKLSSATKQAQLATQSFDVSNAEAA